MPLVTIPAAVGTGMTAAQAAAAAAAAAQAASAATATTTLAAAAPTALSTTAVAPTLATTTAGTVAPGAFGAGVTGAGGTGAGITAGAGGAGSAVPGAFSAGAGGAGGIAPGAFGAGTGGAGVGGAGAGGAGAGAGGGGAGITSGASGATTLPPAGELPVNAFPDFTNPAFTSGASSGTLPPAGGTPFTSAAPAMPPSPTAAPPFAANPAGMTPYPQPTPGMPGNPIDPNAAFKGKLPGVDIPYESTLPQPGIDVPYGEASGNALERGIKSAVNFAKDNPYTMAAGSMAANYLMRPEPPEKKKYEKRDLSGFQRTEPSTSEYTPIYEPQAYAVGGPVERMAAQNAVGANTGYPMANLQTPMYTNPMIQNPEATNVVAPSADYGVSTYSGEPRFAEGGDVPAVDKINARNQKLLGIKTPQEIEEDFQRGQDVMRQEGFGIVTDSDVDTRRKSPLAASMAQLKKIGKRTGAPVSDMPKSGVIDTDVFHAAKGGITYGLGGYSDGGRLLKGPGDGVSDSIPASIGGRQPARLADGEFVVPARIASELGNGSTEAGARKLYAMMERVQASRKKSIGKKKVAVNSKADKHLPA
jgi:hypothetical protein